jgi:hypothetical protein
MASHPNSTTPRLRWGRAAIAAIVAEAVLMCVAVPVYAASANPTPLLNLVIPPASGVIFFAAGYWSALPIPRRGIPQGMLTGIWAVALYLALGLLTSLFVAGTSVTDGFTTAYVAAHGLKVIGATMGGWRVLRKVPAAPAA